jgi:hypothetical protein
MNDNARPRRARVVQDFLERKSIERMDWQARSPDLNPMEYMWNELKVRFFEIVSCNPELSRSLEPCWSKNGQAYTLETK